jgi:hypothetical protein
MKKATYSEEHSRPRKVDSTSKAPSKTTRILSHLLTGASLNRFEAECLGDHCLLSTIALLANRDRLTFKGQADRGQNRWCAGLRDKTAADASPLLKSLNALSAQLTNTTFSDRHNSAKTRA